MLTYLVVFFVVAVLTLGFHDIWTTISLKGSRDSQYEAWANFINNQYLKGTKMTQINQDIVNSNIRGLQSRTDARGKYIAELEIKRTAAKQAVKNLKLLGLKSRELLTIRDELNIRVNTLAKDQRLDRQLLKQQYTLQTSSPSLAKPLNIKEHSDFKIGDVVRIIDDASAGFFSKGCLARLRGQSGKAEWRADFRNLGNPEGSFDDSCDGEWFVSQKSFKHA